MANSDNSAYITRYNLETLCPEYFNGSDWYAMQFSDLSGTLTAASGAHSYQLVSADLTLEAGAGSSDGSSPKFLAGGMFSLHGSSLTADANYLGGMIGQYDVTGVKATTYPTGAVMAMIADGTTDVDGAVTAFIDGDSAVTTANAAFKAMANNSNSGSGFNYGLDLTSAAHDGFAALAILKAAVRLDHSVCIMTGAGVPVDGTTGDNFAGPGSLYVDYTNANLYVQSSAITTPVWKLVTRAA